MNKPEPVQPFNEPEPGKEWRRLHQSTLWLPFLEGLGGILVLAVAAGLVFGARTFIFNGILFFGFPLALYHLVRYLFFRYRLAETELVIREGLLWRQERRIPLRRIQEIQIRQGPLQQLLGLAAVEIKTAGSEAREAVFEVVTREDAENLKARIEGLIGQRTSTTESGSGLLHRLSLSDLLLGALSSKVAGTMLAVVGAILYFKIVLSIGEGFISVLNPPDLTGLDPLSRQIERLQPWKGTLFEPAADFFLDDTLGKSILFILSGFFISLGAFFVRHARYRLSRFNNVLTRTEGLFRLRSESLPRERIQALKIGESFLRRRFGLAEIWLDSGGDQAKQDDQDKRQSFVPVIRKNRALELVPEILPQLDEANPPWKKVSRKAVLRGSKKGWLVLTLLVLLNLKPLGWLVLIFLPFFPLVYVLNVQWFRNTGYWPGTEFLISRKGWFNRTTLYIPVRNLQSVSVIQSPFDQRLDLATLVADTAGQTNTGGGARIRNLPLEEARRIQRELATKAR